MVSVINWRRCLLFVALSTGFVCVYGGNATVCEGVAPVKPSEKDNSTTTTAFTTSVTTTTSDSTTSETATTSASTTSVTTTISTNTTSATSTKCSAGFDLCKINGTGFPVGCTNTADSDCGGAVPENGFQCVAGKGCCCDKDNCNSKAGLRAFCESTEGIELGDTSICPPPKRKSVGCNLKPSITVLSSLIAVALVAKSPLLNWGPP